MKIIVRFLYINIQMNRVHHTSFMKPPMPGSGGKEEKWLAEVLKANENARRDAGGSSSAPQLPRSVRNAPADMRGEIRRGQNRAVRKYDTYLSFRYTCVVFTNLLKERASSSRKIQERRRRVGPRTGGTKWTTFRPRTARTRYNGSGRKKRKKKRTSCGAKKSCESKRWKFE